MRNRNIPPLKLLSTRALNVKEEDVCLIFCIRNEAFRLPFFLDYHRRLGVSIFFAVDNGSTDHSQDYLLEQTDVHLFYTEQEYKASNAGRDWTSWIANQYCTERWVLTLDVDEFFIYPHIEKIPLKRLIEYLQYSGYEGVYSIFLDFYSDTLLSKTVYKEGQSPFDVCGYFDAPESYNCYEREIFPFFEIKGGPRKRVFWPDGDDTVGPSMRKLVLIKWREGFAYTHSTHSCTPIKLADVTGVVAHFKLLSHFKNYAASEVKRNARIANSLDWKVYSNVLKETDPVFYDSKVSIAYKDSQSLINAKTLRKSIS